jgi:nucleotide-binding universal stress UspA family protein
MSTPPAIRTLLVHVQADEPGRRRLAAAAALARRLGATLIGLGAQAIPPIGADPMGMMQGPYIEAMEEVVAKQLEAAHDAFTRATQGLSTEWIRTELAPTDAAALAAFAADLIVAGGAAPGTGDRYHWCDAGEVVLTAGRPVLVAPASDAELRARAALVAWKDTRESRRVLADAIPLLQLAERVRVVEVCEADEADDVRARLQVIAAWLGRHGVTADFAPLPARRLRVAEQLDAAAGEIDADLVVTGGYGHTRMGEWVFGGVTRDLLYGSHRFVLMSH